MNEIYRYRKLHQFGTLILWESKPEEIEKTLFELLPEVIDIDAAALFVLSERNRWILRAASTSGILLKSVRPRLKRFAEKMTGDGNPPEVMASPLIIERSPAGKGVTFPRIVAFPILIMDRISAFLVTARRSDRAYTTDDLNRLDHVAAMLSATMENRFAVRKLSLQADLLQEEKQHLETKVVQRTRELSREREQASFFRERAPYLVFVLNSSGTVVFANAFCVEVTGYPAETITGMNFLDLLYPGDCPEKQEWFTALFKTMDSQSFQATLVASGGDHRMITWNAIKRTGRGGKPAEVICIGKDVTLRTHLEAHNRVLLETLPDGLFRVNQHFEVVEVNRFATDLLGIEPQTLLGRKCYETICKETKETCPIFAKGRDAITCETRIPAGDGEGVPVLKSIRRYRLGANEFALETFKDIGELKRMESEIRDYAENLEKMVAKRTRELEEAQQHIIQFEKLAATGHLAASLAHEINNPIYGIRGCLQSVIEEADLSEEMQRYVELSIQETDRISALVRRLKNFDGASNKVLEPVDVNQVLKDLLTVHDKYLKDRRIAVHAAWARDLPRILLCSDEIKQVFLNLLTNAAEAMPQGGTLHVKTLRVSENAEIAFRDTGCGIPRKVRERIFDPFFTTKSAIKGVGIGLPVCWGIIQRHGGRIRVKSKPGEGSIFTISLPLEKAAGRKMVEPLQSGPVQSPTVLDRGCIEETA